MRKLHVGMGESRGGLTVFPVWGEFAATSDYIWDSTVVDIAEVDGGPTVGLLQMTNAAPLPLLVFEGMIFEGGWQNRMLAHSALIPAGASRPVEVVCVEQGRWDGGVQAHRVGGRRGSARVRLGLRSSDDRQSAVWSQVQRYEDQRGPTMTASYAVHAERGAVDVERLVDGMRALPGQIGVVIGIGGQPVFAEVFANDRILTEQFDALVRGAALDAIGEPNLATPARRARRFIERASGVPMTERSQAGLGHTVRGENEYAQLESLRFQDADLHVVITNPRHQLCLAV